MCRFSCFRDERPCPHLVHPNNERPVSADATGFVPVGLRLDRTLSPDAPRMPSRMPPPTPLPVPSPPCPHPRAVRQPSRTALRLAQRFPTAVAHRWMRASGLQNQDVGWSHFFDHVAHNLFGSNAIVPLPLYKLEQTFVQAGLRAEWRSVCRHLSAATRACLINGQLSPVSLLRAYANYLGSWQASRTPMGVSALHARLRAEGRPKLFWEAVQWFSHADAQALQEGRLSPADFFARHHAAAQMRPDVLVVGAGTAGLAAASALRNAGKRVTVVETRSVVGGRARTQLHGFATRVDLGAARLHSGAENPLTPVAQRLGFTLHADATGGLAFKPAARCEGAEPHNEWIAFDKARVAITQAIFDTASRPHAGAVSDVTLPAVGGWRDSALASLIPLQTGLDPQDQSVEDYFRIMPEAHGDWWIEEGVGEMVRVLGTGLDVHLDTHVKRIEHDGTRVHVHTHGAVYHAAHVLVTVALSEIPKVTFVPPLPPEKAEAIAGLRMGSYEKVILQFSRNIFGNVTPGKHLHIDGPLKAPMDFTLMAPLMETGEAPGHVVVVAYTGGAFAQAMARGGKEAAVAAALGRLRSVYGSVVDECYDHGAQTRWETWTDGAYSAARPGHYAARQELGQPVGERLHFAGEACESKTEDGSTWSTHLAGAYNSGVAAAAEILTPRLQTLPDVA